MKEFVISEAKTETAVLDDVVVRLHFLAHVVVLMAQLDAGGAFAPLGVDELGAAQHRLLSLFVESEVVVAEYI